MFLCSQPWPLTSESHPNQLSLAPLLSVLVNLWSCHLQPFFQLCSFCLWVKTKRINICLGPISFIAYLPTIGSWSLSDHQPSGLAGKEPGPKSQPPPTDLGSAVTLCSLRPLWIQNPSLGLKPRSHVPSCLLPHPQMCRLWPFAPSTLAHFPLSFLPNRPTIRVATDQKPIKSSQPSFSNWTPAPSGENLVLSVHHAFYLNSYFHHIHFLGDTSPQHDTHSGQPLFSISIDIYRMYLCVSSDFASSLRIWQHTAATEDSPGKVSPQRTPLLEVQSTT